MKAEKRSKEQLVEELEELRRQLAASRAGPAGGPGSAATRRKTEERYRQLFEMASDAVFLVDTCTGQILEVNSAATAIYGYDREELLHRQYTELSAEPELTRVTMRERRLRVPLRFHRKKDGSVLPVEITSRYFTWQGREVLLSAVRDISERVAAEEATQRATRALRALSQCNRALVHATREADLLAEICHVIVETAGYRLAWVGFAEQDEAKTVRPVAQAGFEEGYLETVNVTWADTERGRGPTGTAARTAAPCVIKDIPTDPRFKPWRAEATRRGYASCAGLPLLAEGKSFGALTVYAPDRNAFDGEELALLMDLADNLAYGIGGLRAREALRQSRRRKHAELALQTEQRTLRRLLAIHERERQMVAYEIHDGFVQEATAALMQLHAFRAERQPHSEAAERLLDTAAQLLAQSIAEARRLIGGLRPPILDESGVVAAIDYLVCEERRRSEAAIEFECQVRFKRLAAPEETALFRIVQESLTNAVRYSESNRIRIRLTQKGNRIHLLVEDWGAGFDVKMVPHDRFGLRGIRDRAKLLGGRTRIDSTPGKGTRIRVTLPVVEAEAEGA